MAVNYNGICFITLALGDFHQKHRQHISSLTWFVQGGQLYSKDSQGTLKGVYCRPPV